MPFAAPLTAGFAPAKFNGRDIPEKDVANGALGSVDCHFGINGDVSAFVSDAPLNIFGPRALDVTVRGGIVAETLWLEFCNNGTQSMALQGFLTTFDDIGCSRAINPVKGNAYSPGSKISGVDVGGHEKYIPGATHKGIVSITQESDEGSLYQLGTRWSKVAIENTLRGGGRIHFHLDGMGNIHEIINAQGDYSHNVTSRELRYIYRNRGRPELMKAVVFYNGYWISGGGTRKAVVVECPWN